MLTWWYLRRLRSTDDSVRRQARERLIARKTVKPLIQLLKDSLVRDDAIRALGSIGPEATVPLMLALKDPDSRVRTGAALCCPWDSDAVPPLTELLGDEHADASERELAAGALAKLQPSLVLEHVQKGHRHGLLAILETGDSALFTSVMERLECAPGARRSELRSALGEYAYSKLIRRVFEFAVWDWDDEEKAEWIRVLGETLLKMPISGRVNCYQALGEYNSIGQVYGRGQSRPRLPDGCTRWLKAALRELQNVNHFGYRDSIVEHLKMLSSESDTLGDAVAETLSRVTAER